MGPSDLSRIRNMPVGIPLHLQNKQKGLGLDNPHLQNKQKGLGLCTAATTKDIFLP